MRKDIFQYQLDGKTRFADPWAVWSRLTVNLGGDPFSVCERATSAEGKSEVEIAQATSQIYEAVVAAFNLPSFDSETGQGATMADVTRIWNGLIEFNAECKKKSDGSPICSLPSI